MNFELGHNGLWLGGRGRSCGFVLSLLLSASMAAHGQPGAASRLGDDPATMQEQPSVGNGARQQNQQAEQTQEPRPSAPAPAPDSASAPSSAARAFCDALATAAAANDLPLDFFVRLIWQESRFQPDAISRAGAQGVAQFMPATARLRGLANPFDALEAIAKSASLLRDLNREFGNLGLAAAAYNAGPGRVRDWLGGGRPLPGETRAYVRIVTGRSVEEWAGGKTDATAMPPPKNVPCNVAAIALVEGEGKSPPKAEIVKPWGVEVVGGPTPAKALARYREWLLKYASLVGDREPHVVIRGILGNMGAARVRVGEDTQAAAGKLCAALRKAGTYCDVLRN